MLWQDLNKKYQFKIQIVDSSYWDCKSESVSHSVVSDSLWPDGLYVAHEAPLSMEFSRQEYWNG